MMRRLAIFLAVFLLLVGSVRAGDVAAGSTDKEIGFVARDATDFRTREIELSSFTVVYCIDGGTDVTMTTPTVTEVDAATMPGHYWLSIDEAGMTTLQAGDDKAELQLYITHAGLYEDVSGYRFTTKALEQAPSGSGATAEEVRIEMDSNSTQFAAIVEDTGTTIPGLISAIGGGDGSVVVDHDTGGADALAYETAGGVGIDNGVIRAYLKSDYDAGNTGSAYIKATTTTDVNGRWTSQMNLDPGDLSRRLYRRRRNTGQQRDRTAGGDPRGGDHAGVAYIQTPRRYRIERCWIRRRLDE